MKFQSNYSSVKIMKVIFLIFGFGVIVHGSHIPSQTKHHYEDIEIRLKTLYEDSKFIENKYKIYNFSGLNSNLINPNLIFEKYLAKEVIENLWQSADNETVNQCKEQLGKTIFDTQEDFIDKVYGMYANYFIDARKIIYEILQFIGKLNSENITKVIYKRNQNFTLPKQERYPGSNNIDKINQDIFEAEARIAEIKGEASYLSNNTTQRINNEATNMIDRLIVKRIKDCLKKSRSL